MARLLVLARGDDRGEVVAAKPDSHIWGTLERQPDFVRVNITDLTLPEMIQSRMRPLLQPVLVRNLESGKWDQLTRRRFRIRPLQVASWIQAGQWMVDLTEEELLNAIQRLRDDGTPWRNANRSEIEAAFAKLASGDEAI